MVIGLAMANPMVVLMEPATNGEGVRWGYVAKVRARITGYVEEV
jgi:hypothetical protein